MFITFLGEEYWEGDDLMIIRKSEHHIFFPPISTFNYLTHDGAGDEGRNRVVNNKIDMLIRRRKSINQR